MYRQTHTDPAPAHTPPLHHPVPQHVSTVPQLRSPPPSVSNSQNPSVYSNPYQPQVMPDGSSAFGAYGNFISDPTAQIGFQVGQTALKHGTEYMEQNINRYFHVSALKHYFKVSNSYVVNKILLVLFPWRHKPWSRKMSVGPNGQEGWFLPPRDDLNSPDMYIPLMALVTYILLSTIISSLSGGFEPELLGYNSTFAFFIVIIEIALLKLGCYLLSISNESQLLDLVAYSGYKFVGAITTLLVSKIFNPKNSARGWIGWTIFIYTFLANALFLLRSLKYVLLPEHPSDERGTMQTVARAQKSRRTQFLFIYSYPVQLFIMGALTHV
ncbi:Protein transport protein yif1 [Golovinomyces cichoracearum]|uniref:Protein YIF1 n=1 Tax=Golovinomyces cichoracearum TaxID=62708 RepID=A0A420IVG4_9PEZI|nr:Protein transport protein yif1 [Golovinomyces cichoracearum]